MNNTFSFNNTSGSNANFVMSGLDPAYQTDNFAVTAVQINPKCKCPNPKHTNGCSIEPESEYCVWCAKGCVKRVQAIHVKYT